MIVGIVALAVIGNLGPGTEAANGRQMKASHKRVINDLSILENGESIEWFYSDAMMDIREGMYMVTDRRLILYRTEWEDPLLATYFTNLVAVEFEANKSFFEDSMFTVELINGEEWMFPISSDRDHDDKLSPEQAYGQRCAWELEINEDNRAPEERSAESGLKILRGRTRVFSKKSWGAVQALAKRNRSFMLRRAQVMKRHFIVELFTVAAFLVGSAIGLAAQKRPNVLFIMSDDHTAQAVGAYATVLKELDPTPTIDTLAAEGITFDNAFCVNAICTPSRACIITGQYPHVNGVFDLGGRIKPENQTLPILFRAAGYQTAMIGKWHLKEEPNFDYYKVLPGQGKFFNTQFRIQGDKKWPLNTVTHEGEHSSDCITDSTLDWFKNRRDPNKPFFVCHQYKAPHDYFENAERYQSYLAAVHIPEVPTLYDVPKTFGSIATRGHNDELMPHIGTSIGKRNPRRSYAVDLYKKFPEEFPSYYDYEKMSEKETTRLAYQAYLKKYLRCVKGVDDNLKRLFDYMKKEGLYDNTVIIYTGDQGFWLGENDYQDKRWAYDPSMRMPFIVRYPKAIKAGIRSDAIVENVDYPALMLDFAGIERPKAMQGRSFKSICETGREPKDWKTAAYYRYWMHMAHHDNPGEMAMRTKTHKLIYFYAANYQGENQTPPGWELYDLRKDPEELNNVYDDPAYSKVRDRLKKQFAELRKDIGDDGTHHPACERVVQEFWDYDDADRAKAIEISAAFLKSRLASLKRPSAPKRKSGRIRRNKAGWILPAKSEAQLRKHQGLTEISRGAVYKVSHPGNPSFNTDNAHLLSAIAPQVKQHAFHTPEVNQPSVVIKLDQPSHIGHVRIINRTGTKDIQARASGLTLSLSQNGKDWQKAWQAESVQAIWNVATDGTAQFLKLSLPRKGTLHLNQVVVFGKPATR